MFKKILFIDTIINKRDATGITLSNLFEDWPNESLYFIVSKEQLKIIKEEGFNNFYSLTENEKKHRFPVNLFTKKSEYSITINNSNHQNQVIKKAYKQIKTNSLGKYLYELFGLNLYFTRIIISDNLNNWINKNKPDYFYCVLSTRHSILFAHSLVEKYKIPLIIHIMDDWPNTIGKNTLFPKFWSKKINKELISLFKISYKYFAISKSMAEEYKIRFGGDWQYFHNVVDKSLWGSFNKSKCNKNTNSLFKIGYFGRIGRANDEIISDIIKIINDTNELNVELHIYTDILKSSIELCQTDKIKIYQFITSFEIPKTVTSYDYLLLPLSFNKEDLVFSKFSFPTKFSEYLISGVPIILIAPETTAIFKYAEENNCAFLINDCSVDVIKDGLNKIINDTSLANEISKNGIQIAEKELDKLTMGSKFVKLLNDL